MSSETYPGGIDAVLAQYEGRRDPFSYAPGEGLAPLDSDLAALAAQTVADPAADREERPPFRSSYHRKRFKLRQELTGQSELVVLHGLTVSHLRKRAWPAHAPALFQRLWAEQGDHLLGALDPRWLVSAVTTFGDHGATPVQRSTGLALTALFGTMKLYESERLYSGLTPDRAFPLSGKVRASLPMDMDGFALQSGGLDVNLIGRLWQEAEGCAVIRPLAHRLLTLLIQDDRTVMRRLRIMRARKARKSNTPEDPEPKPAPRPPAAPAVEALRWGIVATVKAPLCQIARFAAHHLDLGAEALHLYLDDPQPGAMHYLSRDPRIIVTACDAAYYQAIGKTRPDAHQQRQALNATRALKAADGLHWLAHIDVDEFLIADRPVTRALAGLPPDAAVARLPPLEALARDDGWPEHFKLTDRDAGAPPGALQEIYPTFGLHLRAGFLSHSKGKAFARTGIPGTRFGIHTMKLRGEEVETAATLDGLWLAHVHAPDWAYFAERLEFRRTRGSYRPQEGRPELGAADLIDFLLAEQGEAGLRLFFDEVCADTPALRDRLKAHGMLRHHRFDLDGAVTRVFGRAP
ncbi:glycosyltransferase family 2 protein [Thetidibacter halocola]|uniref:Glycosyltransferase family 2 protein n=1 Tax=Thetidibacter halocola TaxID=2827239 RepID=A0A8J7WFD0_9RHOB|nr:glycosyltransferase family 2 protein [Thetidibacter halocola]MBS0124313.1 glycosyltransferase family 2 protein [Thetidibacter halocola]